VAILSPRVSNGIALMSPFLSETSQPIDVFAAISPGLQGGASDVLPYTSMRPTGDESSFSINYQRSVYRAEVVGVDPGKDIAVLKITAPANELHPIQVGTSKGLRVGQMALAIGNPFGLDHTLTGEKMLSLLPTCPDTKINFLLHRRGYSFLCHWLLRHVDSWSGQWHWSRGQKSKWPTHFECYPN
jgi:hypothetical protein